MSDRDKKLDFSTRVIHECLTPEEWEGATLPPIYQTASHRHPTAESLSDTFGGKSSDHIYMRLTNPTNRVLEKKLAALEGGAAAVVMASGMAAITNACMALLRAGDEFVCTRSLFMSTYILFANVFAKYGIRAVMVDGPEPEKIAAAISEKTRFVYLETIGNPMMDVPDFAAVAEAAHSHGVPLPDGALLRLVLQPEPRATGQGEGGKRRRSDGGSGRRDVDRYP